MLPKRFTLSEYLRYNGILSPKGPNSIEMKSAVVYLTSQGYVPENTTINGVRGKFWAKPEDHANPERKELIWKHPAT